MPGFYIHISVADHVASRLSTLDDEWPMREGAFGSKPISGPAPGRLAALARDNPNYYALGAIGPDLFFLLPDFRSKGERGEIKVGNTLVGVADFVDDFMTKLDEWILDWWEPTFGPFFQNFDEAVSRLTGDLSTEISDALGALSSLTTTAALALGSLTNDWIGNFSLGHNEGLDNRAFLWSDMLHYRKTSQFGQKLWEFADKVDQADPNAKIQADRLRAYALGYMTHLATDVTGHPFTNEKSGGPFRTHWQRHKLVENHMDARVYDREHGVDAQWSELAGSALHYEIGFDDDGNITPRPNLPEIRPTIRNLYERRQALDIASDLPIEVATLLYEAMGSAYVASAQPNHPTESTPNILAGDGRPSPDAIQDTYGLFFRYMKHTVMDGYWHEKPMPPELFPNLNFPLLTAPGEEAPGETDEEMDFLDWLLAIVRFCLFIPAVVAWILTLPLAVILDTATFGPRNAIYYGIDLPVYYMTLAFRRILVMTGYLLPRREEIAIDLTRLGTGPRDLFLGTLEAIGDTLMHLTDETLARLGAEAERLAAELNRDPQDVLTELLGEVDALRQKPTEPTPDREYPRQHEHFEHLHPWRYPQTDAEVGTTTAGPFRRRDDATLLVERTMRGEAVIREHYESSSSPERTEEISRQEMNREANLGDPISFSTYLIWQLTRSERLDDDTARLTDWNLDADRGYAWKCWDWNRSPERTFEDSEGNNVQRPCTPPSQFDEEKHGGPGHDPNVPLRIHWADADDPHCREERQ